MNKGIVILTVGAVLVAGGVFAKKSMVEDEIRKHLDESVGKASMFADIKYTDVSASLNPLDTAFTVSGITIKPKSLMPGIPSTAITIKSITMSDYATADTVPENYSIVIDDFVIDVPQEKKGMMRHFSPFTKRVGNQIVADLSLNYTFNNDGQTYDMNYILDIEKIGKIDINLQLDDMKETLTALQIAAKNPQAAAMKGSEHIAKDIMAKASLKSFTLKVSNSGLFDIIVEGVAEKQKATKAEVIELIHAELDKNIARAERRGKSTGVDFLTQAKVFIDNPKTFTVTIKPGDKKLLQDLSTEIKSGSMDKNSPAFKVDFSS